MGRTITDLSYPSIHSGTTAWIFEMARAMQLDFLYVVPGTMLFVAPTAWVVTFAALMRCGARCARLRVSSAWKSS